MKEYNLTAFLKNTLCYSLFVFVFLFMLCSSTVAATPPNLNNNLICPKEQFYLEKQQPVQVNKECKLQSIFYFPSTVKAAGPLTPLNNEYKTHLNIPKAKID